MWVCGCVGGWVCGSVGVWVARCVGVWVCGWLVGDGGWGIRICCIVFVCVSFIFLDDVFV